MTGVGIGRLRGKACGDQPASRKLVRDILYGQLFGVDINRSALGIAAFSLYLAALELDQEPIADIADLKFHRLIDETLFEANSLSEDLPPALLARPFDAVVGNPPWTFVGQAGTSARRSKGDKKSLRPRRSPDQGRRRQLRRRRDIHDVRSTELASHGQADLLNISPGSGLRFQRTTSLAPEPRRGSGLPNFGDELASLPGQRAAGDFAAATKQTLPRSAMSQVSAP